jgi:hypothetical protein
MLTREPARASAFGVPVTEVEQVEFNQILDSA